MGNRIIQTETSVLEVEHYCTRRNGDKEFNVYLKEGGWPKRKRDLLALIDGGAPDMTDEELLFSVKDSEMEAVSLTHVFVKLKGK